ncbi:MAG TPA: ferredoxin, partial [Polyangia bacterium]
MTTPVAQAVSPWTVAPDACVRCGACTLLAPRVFSLEPSAARATGVPAAATLTFEDTRAAVVARLICPAHAIRGGREAPLPIVDDTAAAVSAVALFDAFSRGSERVRWRLDELDWGRLDLNRASPALCALVREMAFSEHATFSATHRFMQTFADDTAFTAWLSIWFYEETRHPHALMAWLTRVGAAPGDLDDFTLRGRVSAPFMKSKMGTLVTNIISEITAAAGS